jgi:hypothetical protein
VTKENVITLATAIEYERAQLRQLEAKVATKKRRISSMERDMDAMIETIRREGER